MFVSCRYNAKVNFIEGRCPGSKAMDFDNPMTRVTVPNVNIGDCDYTIAFWIRLSDGFNGADIFGSSRSGKLLTLSTNGMSASSCHEVSTSTVIYATCVYGSLGVVVNNWTHIAVTCEQDNRIKIFSNGEMANITQRLNLSYQEVYLYLGTPPPKEMFVIKGNYYNTVIMDLHILGFALPPDDIYDLYKG